MLINISDDNQVFLSDDDLEFIANLTKDDTLQKTHEFFPNLGNEQIFGENFQYGIGGLLSDLIDTVTEEKITNTDLINEKNSEEQLYWIDEGEVKNLKKFLTRAWLKRNYVRKE